MTHQFPHPHTTLPGHDPSKVRGYTAPDCITASASEALDVRIFKCIETLLTIDRKDVHSEYRNARAGQYARLQTIAAEIRDAATPRRPLVDSDDIIAIWNADTVTQMRDAWARPTARADAEAKRQADEARAANLAHRATINRAALAAIQAVITAHGAGTIIAEEAARAIVTAIARGEVPHVSVNY